MHQLNTKIANLEEKLDNMSMPSSGEEYLDEVDMVREDEVKKDALPKSKIWSDYPRIQRRHTITNSYTKSKSGRKN